MTPHPPQPRRQSTAAWQWTLVISLGALITVTSFAAGILTERDLLQTGSRTVNEGQPGGVEASDATPFARLGEIYELIESEYYFRPKDEEDLEAFREDLENRAIQGMLSGLDDNSAYLIPVEQAPVAEQLSGEYEGIGIWVESPNGEFTIVAPVPGSPAERAGLRAGDVIEEADGHSLRGVTQQDAIALLRGPAGTTVHLKIRRPGVPELLEFEVERQKIPLPAVAYRFLPEQKIAVVQVKLFGDKTTEELDQALAQARRDGAAGIILDLRNNGGGWVQSAQEMIGRFVPADAGPALYEDVDGDPDDPVMTPEPIIGGGEEVFDLPLVVLVNGGTASAAEIVAGALRDYERAVIVGEPTFGKGSVQRVHGFPDGASARITFALWLTPNRTLIEENGITPDITVAGGEDGGADPQLEAAIQQLLGGGTPVAGEQAWIPTPTAEVGALASA